ncbi:serine/threonine-protein kinase [Frigoriglobus tundricola]|uniref:Protein kinase domain-containing protein n=1 Tax=Frigoriglobus tundricola TaxID=2774151 RepID=A0A6M5YJF3_9BACT|nr:serine/threonine-protein kinase [Frigoriglobus tundricola]QJW93684.1 hypothetical protein FTUN_1192 [Frigoriglobus tundricola]
MSDANPPDDGTRRSPPPSGRTGAWSIPDVPMRLGRFEIRQLIGEGAFGRVFLAFDPQLGRQVAIKVPHRDGLTPAFRDRFLREARATATIHHPNVCPVHDVGTDGDLPYIVMHYVVGGTLAGLIEKLTDPLPIRKAVVIARKLALGMAAAHEQGVIHRDLKLQNVLIDRASREVLITDFGLARLDGQSRVTVDGAVFGTPAYMSPEQARGLQDGVGPLSDVYSLGVILYHLLTGDVPFRGTVFEVLVQHWETSPRPPSALRADVSPELDAICLRAMAKAPADRYPSAKAFARALSEYLRESGSSDAASGDPVAETVTPQSTHATSPVPAKKPAPTPPRGRPSPVPPKAAHEPQRPRKRKAVRPEPEELPYGEPVRRRTGRAVLIAGFVLISTAVGAGIALRDPFTKPTEDRAASNPSVAPSETETPDPPPPPDERLAPPPHVPAPKPTPPKVEPPRAPVADIRALAREMDLPPFKPGGATVVLADHPFPPDLMKEYAADVPLDTVLKDKGKYRFRVTVLDALNEIRTQWSPTGGTSRLRVEVKEPLAAVKAAVKKEQEFWAIGITQLERQLFLLEAVAPMRAGEKKRWQANYDYARASVKARLVYMNEYDKVLGNLNTETLPALNAKKGENGYTLVASEALKSGKDIKKVAEEAHALFQEIAVKYKGTPWGLLAERDLKVPLGFNWKPATIGTAK